VSHDSQRAYVSNRLSNTISVIDIAKQRVLETLPTGAGPTGITLDSAGDRLFVANAKDNTISVFDLKSHQKPEEIKLPLDVDFPGGLTLLPNKCEILVSSEATEAIGLLNANTLSFERQPVIGHPSDDFLWVPLENE
jgi:YVTN family beta-propeller protein